MQNLVTITAEAIDQGIGSPPELKDVQPELALYLGVMAQQSGLTGEQLGLLFMGATVALTFLEKQIALSRKQNA